MRGRGSGKGRTRVRVGLGFGVWVGIRLGVGSVVGVGLVSMPSTAHHAYEHVREDLLRVSAEVVRVEH